MSTVQTVRIAIKAPFGSGGRRGWIKLVTGVNVSAGNGYALEGSLLADKEHNIPVGSILLEQCPTGSVKSPSQTAYAYRVEADGSLARVTDGHDWRTQMLSLIDAVAALFPAPAVADEPTPLVPPPAGKDAAVAVCWAILAALPLTERAEAIAALTLKAMTTSGPDVSPPTEDPKPEVSPPVTCEIKSPSYFDLFNNVSNDIRFAPEHREAAATIAKWYARLESGSSLNKHDPQTPFVEINQINIPHWFIMKVGDARFTLSSIPGTKGLMTKVVAVLDPRPLKEKIGYWVDNQNPPGRKYIAY